MIARLLLLVWLVVVWVALWESLTVANLLSGVAVAAVLLALFPTRAPSPRTGRFRPLGALRFLGSFTWKLVQANLVVAWEVVTPNNERVKEGVVAVPVHGSSDVVVTLLANAISLTPGTLTLDIGRDPTVLYVHVLHLTSPAAARLDVHRLERSVLRAIGTDDALAAVERRIAADERALRGGGPDPSRTTPSEAP